MHRGRARKFAIAATAALLLAISAFVAWAATSHHSGSSPRALKLACASDLYNAKDVLHFVSRASACDGQDEKLVDFAKDFPVYTCRKEHGTLRNARGRKLRAKKGIRSYGPAGLMRLVDDPSKCGPDSQPNETPITLPALRNLTFCAAKRGGELRFVRRARQCDRKEFPVRLAARIDVGSENPAGDPVANDDSGSTDEDHGVDVDVLANDKNTPSSNSNAGLAVASTDTSNTKGQVSVNANGTIRWEPNGQFESLKPGETATDTFEYRAAKGAQTSAPAKVTITVGGVNDAPVANDDAVSTPAGATKVVSVLGNDSDADGDALTVGSLDTGGTKGTVTITNGGADVTYDPNGQFKGLKASETATDTFKYRAKDGSADSNLATVTVTINGESDAPVAVADSAFTNEDSVLSKNAAAGVLSNDSDPEGDPLTASLATGPSHAASFALHPDGSYSYTPNANFNGSDSFTYKANDGSQDSTPATVTITVNPVNDAPVAADDSGSTDEDTTLTKSAAAGVLSNDSDVDGDTLSAVKVTDPANGSLTLNADGSYSYVPNANFSGTDSFTYKANDGVADSATKTVSLTIASVNDAPVAVDDSGTTDEDTSLTRTAANGVLANDTDVEGSSLTATKVTDPAHGALTLNSDGSYSYTPDLNFSGSDSFTYTASDGSDDSNTATVDITVNPVNDVPIAFDDVTSTDEDSVLSVNAAGGVLGNDSDADGDSLTAVLVSGPSHGSSFALNSDGSYDYTPNANFNGSDSFTYKANDGSADSNTATVTITVNSVNDAPVANDDTVSTDEDTTLSTTAATGVLANDTDTEGSSLTATKVTDPAHGALTLNSDGSYDYTPDLNFNGSDSFTYTASDGSADSNTATVNITVNAVNDVPIAIDDTASVDEDNPLTKTAATGVLANDSDADGDTLTATVVGNPAHAASFTLNSDGSYTYTPNADFNGSDSFTYTASDGSATSNTATVNITVNAVNDAPVAVDDTGTVDEDNTLTVTTLNGVLANDSDTEGSSLTATKTTDPAHGSVTVNSDGSYTYTPDLNFNGSDSFTYTASDGSLDSNTATVNITVNPVNDAPSAVDDAVSVDEDATLTKTAADGVLANDGDVDGDTITAQLVTSPAHDSSFTLNPDGSWSYTPDTNYNGSDSFTYKTNDGTADSPTNATVNITVNAVNDAPVNTVPGSKTVNEDSTLTLATATSDALSTADIDAGSDDVRIALSVQHGTLTLGGTTGLDFSCGGCTGDGTADQQIIFQGTLTEVNTALDGLQYAPNANFNGADFLSFTTADNAHNGSGGIKQDSDTVNLTVDPVNDAPVATGDSYSVDEDTLLNPSAGTGVLANDSDVDGTTPTAVIDTGPSNASSFTLNSDGSFSYTPNANFHGADSFTYHATDTALDSSIVTVNITVGSVNDAPVNGVPGTQTINEDGSLTLSGGNAPTVSDVDAGSDNLTVTLGVTDGVLSLSGTSGLTVTGNGTDSISATGSITDLNTALDGLKYTPDANFNGADAISMQTSDLGHNGSGGAKTDTDSITVNVTGVNDGPVNTVPGSQTTNEDTALTFSSGNGNQLSFDDSDSATDDLTITLTATNGVATLATTAGLTSFTGDGTSSVTATGTEAELNAALNGLVFTPNADFFGAGSIELLTDDLGHNGTGGSLTDDDTVSITVNSINDAPIVTSPVTQNTPEDTQLTINPAPTVTDADSGADDVQVAVSVSNGTLTLATTVGITSFTLGDGTDDAAITFEAPLSVANNALNGIKYTPNNDFTGGEGFNVSVSDLGHNGSGGAKSDTANTTIVVGPVNDPPVVDLNGGGGGTSTNPTFLEVVTHDNSVQLAPSASVTDVDDTNIESATITLTNRPDGTAESLAVNTGGTAITADPYDSTTGVLFLHGSAPKADYAQVIQTLTYANTASPPAATDRSITVKVNDGDADSATATSTVQVVPLNTPPIVDLDTTDPSFDSSATFTEDSPAVNIAPNTDITDADAADTHMESATITLTNRPDGANESLSTDASGTSGITVTAYDSSTGVLALSGHGTIADYETLISRVKYDNSSQNPDTTDRDVTVEVSDGQATSTTRHATVHVNRHNDPITNTVPGGQGFAEDTAMTFTTSNSNLISIADADAGAGSVKVTVSADHGSLSANTPASGTRTGNGTHSLELTGTVSAVNTALDGLTYTPDANYNGADTITVLSDDQGNSGGAATTDSDTIAITLSAVNDAPQNTVPGSQSVNEDTALAFSSGNGNQVSVADVDAGASQVKVKLEVAHGALTMTTTTGLTFSTGDGLGDPTMEFTGTLTNVNAALNTLSYQGTLNYNGPDTLTVTTDDQGNTGAGGALNDVDTVAITVNPVNDAPTATGDASSTDEDTQLNVAAPGVLANDSDIDSGSITAVKDSDPSHGTVTLNSNGSFTYDPTANYCGADSFTYHANDGSLDSNVATVNLTVNCVNDAPSNTVPGSQTVDEDTTLTFNSGNGNLISTSDSDAGASQVQVTLAALHGGITLSGTTGLSFSVGDGSGDSTMTFTGTLTNVNSALNGLSYLGTLNYNGPEQLTLTVNDQGNTGAGGAKQDSDTVNITVNPVNDNPVATDETFNATNSAIGNTTLNVNDTATTGAGAADGRPATPDPTDTSPTTDRPHKEITGNIFANDTDVDNNSNEFTAVPGTFATNDGGTVTIQSDGDFNFEPAPSTSCTDTSDFFDYTVSDNVSSGAGPNPGTDTGRVTIAITGCVWYVNNNDAQGNSGTSEKPYDTIAQAQVSSGNGHTTFVYDGDDTTTGYNTGYTMNASESLLSEGATLQIGSDVLHTADAANKASLTNNNADVVTLAGGATVKSFNIDPQGTGGGIFGTGLGATTVTLDDLNIVDNGTKGTQPGLELDTNTGTTTNVSNLTVNNGDGSSATTGDAGVRLNATGTVNFASTGTISITTNGAPGLVAAAGAGTTSLGSASTFDDITVTNSGAGGVSLSGTTGSGTAYGDGSGNDLQLTTVSGAPAAFSAQTSGSFSVPSAGQSDISATGGPAVDVVSSSGSTMAFDGVSSTNSANDGVNIDSIGTGTFSATSGTVGGEAGIGFDLNGGSGAITYPATFNNGTGSLVAEVTGRSGGVVSLSGDMNDTNDAGGGVNIASNTGGSTVLSGATKQFNTGASDAVTFSASDGHTFVLSGGGTDIDTTSGNGVNATTSGTFQVSGSGNTIDSTALGASNRGLNISDTDIASADVTFQRISTSGGTNGVRINNNANSLGDFTITGAGGTCTAADQTGCSGGIIQSATGAGIDLATMPASVSLTRVNVKSGGDDGIRASSVGSSAGNGIALANSVITSNGNANTENGVDYTNVNGTSSINNDAINSNFDFNTQINGTSGTLNLTVQSSTFNSAGVDDGLQINSDGTSTINATIGGSGVGNTFTANKGDAFQMSSTNSGDSPVSNTTFGFNTITGSGATATDAGIAWAPVGNAKFHAISNNIQNVSVTAVSVQSGASTNAGATTDATVESNTIGTSGQVDSGSVDGDGIQIKSPSDGTSKFLVKNNNIHGYDKNGMLLRGSESTNGADTDITATGNTIDTPDTTHAETGILLQAGSLSADVVDVCADVGGAGGLANTFSGALNFSGPGIGNFWLSLRFANSKMKAPGYVGTTFTDRQNYFLGRNTGFSGGAAPYVEDGAQNLTTPSPANCLQPTLPSTG